jgi:hypothetical protein
VLKIIEDVVDAKSDDEREKAARVPLRRLRAGASRRCRRSSRA